MFAAPQTDTMTSGTAAWPITRTIGLMDPYNPPQMWAIMDRSRKDGPNVVAWAIATRRGHNGSVSVQTCSNGLFEFPHIDAAVQFTRINMGYQKAEAEPFQIVPIVPELPLSLATQPIPEGPKPPAPDPGEPTA